MRCQDYVAEKVTLDVTDDNSDTTSRCEPGPPLYEDSQPGNAIEVGWSALCSGKKQVRERKKEKRSRAHRGPLSWYCSGIRQKVIEETTEWTSEQMTYESVQRRVNPPHCASIARLN